MTYAVVAQSLLMVMSAFGNRELSEAIVKGTIAVDLARPIDFYLYWAALDLGRAVYYLFFRGHPDLRPRRAALRRRVAREPGDAG